MASPADGEGPEGNLKRLLREIHSNTDVARDNCLTSPKWRKERFIQMILAEANYLLDAAMLIAQDEKIEFSFQGMDLKYEEGSDCTQPQQVLSLVHPDTERLNEVLASRGGWDQSNCVIDYDDDDED